MNEHILQLYLQGKVSPEESKRITEWIESNPKNLEYYQTIARLYEATLWNEPTAKTKSRKNTIIRKISFEFIKIASVLVIGFFIYKLLLNDASPIVDYQILNVPSGQTANIILSDGSKVWLNAGSTLKFPSYFTGKERNVILDGEGFFDVISNKENPFVVTTSKYQIKALGTSFNVVAYNDSQLFETALVTGILEVKNENQEVILSPEQQVSLHDGLLIKSKITDHNRFLWREGILSFDTSINDILDKLQLYFDIKIENKRSHLLDNTRHCTAKFRTRDGLEHILKSLQFTYHFNFTIDRVNNIVFIN